MQYVRSEDVGGINMSTQTTRPVVRWSRPTVVSGVLALVTVVAFAAFSWCAGNGNIPRHVHLESLIIAAASSIVTIIAGIAALLMVLLRSKQMKGHSIAITSVVVGSVILSILVPNLIFEKKMNDILECMKKLQGLGGKIREYADSHDGYLPVADNWCDLLMENNKDLSRDSFSCPASAKGVCSYAFNRNLGGVRLADVPRSIVLLYGTDGGWNHAGKGESLATRHDGGCNVQFINHGTMLYHQGILHSLKNSAYWELEDADEKSSSE